MHLTFLDTWMIKVAMVLKFFLPPTSPPPFQLS